jgi:prepilin-type N-terminal cleavage/methylation domain-containing protein
LVLHEDRILIAGMSGIVEHWTHFLEVDEGAKLWYPMQSGAIIVAAYGVLGMFWISPQKSLRPIAWVSLAFALGACLWWMISNQRFVWEEVITRSVLLAALTANALLFEKLRQKVDRLVSVEEEAPTPRRQKPGRVNLGFTVTELLVVIVILVILAAITIPLIGKSKEGAHKAAEEVRLRQLYVALNLYEGDHDHQPLPSLANLEKTYVKSSFLENDQDVRRHLDRKDWPANLWVNIAMADPPEVMKQRSKVRIGYFYLKPFEGRFPPGRTFAEYRNKPEVGLIAGVGLMQCGPCNGPNCIGGCLYWRRKPEEIQGGQPAANLHGPIGIVRTDGSIFFRHRPSCGDATYGHVQLFLGGSLECGGPREVHESK